MELWTKLFYLKQQGPKVGVMSECGAAVITGRPDRPFPKLPLEDSAKKWQTTFFYVRNADLAVDVINLLEFRNAPPREKPNWGYCPKKPRRRCGRPQPRRGRGPLRPQPDPPWIRHGSRRRR